MAADAPSYEAAAAALKDDADALIGRWLDAYVRAPMRMPSPVDEASFRQLVAGLVESLGEALSPGPDGVQARLAAGAAEVREVEKSAAFAGASLGAAGASAFDVAALFFTLREVLAPLSPDGRKREIAGFLEWLAVIAADALASARERSAHEKLRDELDDGTPVVLITPELPAALFVARPEPDVVRSVLSRLLLQVVRVGAKAVILDVGGLAEASRPALLDALPGFVGHRKIAGRVEVIVVGTDSDDEAAWKAHTAEAGTVLHIESCFEAAVARGLATTGQRLISR